MCYVKKFVLMRCECAAADHLMPLHAVLTDDVIIVGCQSFIIFIISFLLVGLLVVVAPGHACCCVSKVSVSVTDLAVQLYALTLYACSVLTSLAFAPKPDLAPQVVLLTEHCPQRIPTHIELIRQRSSYRRGLQPETQPENMSDAVSEPKQISLVRNIRVFTATVLPVVGTAGQIKRQDGSAAPGSVPAGLSCLVAVTKRQPEPVQLHAATNNSHTKTAQQQDNVSSLYLCDQPRRLRT
jgi:hypothetical protein